MNRIPDMHGCASRRFRRLASLFLLALTGTAWAQVSISLQSADLAMIPGSKRTVYAKVQGTQILGVRWAVRGGCTLASTTTLAEPQIVTAPDRGAACSVNRAAPTAESPSFGSPVSCTIQAESVADGSKAAYMTIPVCAPQVMLSTFPATTVLYEKQFAVIQSDLRGSTNTAVTWEITVNPGRAGSLMGGNGNRHAVFSAAAPGTYVLTATSLADKTKKASTTIVVTGHPMPQPAQDHTEAVDCTAVGGGKTYEVGPKRQYVDLNAVPWNSVTAGDTVRIHNDDTSGRSPTIYRQQISIPGSGTATKPIRVCGVPDDRGNKPIIDGDHAASRRDADWSNGYIDGQGLVTLFDSAHRLDPRADGAQNILIEGLHIRNANKQFRFVKQANGALTPFDDFSACIRVQTGRKVMIRGNELENCGQGIFVNGQTPLGNLVTDLTVEGNYVHGWGWPRDESVHGMYLQTLGLQVQFNYLGASTPGAPGNAIKTRSVMNFIRWNYISLAQSNARSFDMVEPQGFVCYVTPFDFAFVYHAGGKNSDCVPPGKGPEMDPMKADEVAANFEAYHFDYLYGNLIDDAGSGSSFVHYGYDQQTPEGPRNDRRGGHLFYWKNTHQTRTRPEPKTIFDPSSPDQGHSGEFPVITSLNNVFSSEGSGAFRWTGAFWAAIQVDSNWINPNYLLPNRNADDSYQGGTSRQELDSCNRYGFCHQGNGHMTWMRNHGPGQAGSQLYLGPKPFRADTFVPDSKLRGIAASLPMEIRDQPSNMEYFPATNTIAPISDGSYLGALD